MAAQAPKDTVVRVDELATGLHVGSYRVQDMAMSPLQYRGWLAGITELWPTYRPQSIDQLELTMAGGVASPTLPAFNMGNQLVSMLGQLDFTYAKKLPLPQGWHGYVGGVWQTLGHMKYHTGLQNTFLFWDLYTTLGPTALAGYRFAVGDRHWSLGAQLKVPLLGLGLQHNFTNLFDAQADAFFQEMLQRPQLLHPGNFTRWQAHFTLATGSWYTAVYTTQFYSARHSYQPARLAQHQFTVFFNPPAK